MVKKGKPSENFLTLPKDTEHHFFGIPGKATAPDQDLLLQAMLELPNNPSFLEHQLGTIKTPF